MSGTTWSGLSTKYVVSEYFKVDNGLIIILPNLHSSLSSDNSSSLFINSILHLLTEIRKGYKYNENKIPDWVNKYYLTGEKTEIDNLSKLEFRKQKVDLLINESKKKLTDYHFLKSLFASDGETLEKAVEFIFKNMGFDIEKSNKNEEDLLLKIDSKIAVVEIKGLTKSAAEKNAAQLQKWVSNYHVENEYNPKGILVVNTYKNEEIAKRKEVDFPDQMLRYSKQMNHCLITGLQLLNIYLDYKSNKLKRTEIIALLFNTSGVVEYKEKSRINLK